MPTFLPGSSSGISHALESHLTVLVFQPERGWGRARRGWAGLSVVAYMGNPGTSEAETEFEVSLGQTGNFRSH